MLKVMEALFLNFHGRIMDLFCLAILNIRYFEYKVKLHIIRVRGGLYTFRRAHMSTPKMHMRKNNFKVTADGKENKISANLSNVLSICPSSSFRIAKKR
jgi:hypothetical protein